MRSSTGELWTQNAALKENLERERAEFAVLERNLRVAVSDADKARGDGVHSRFTFHVYIVYWYTQP